MKALQMEMDSIYANVRKGAQKARAEKERKQALRETAKALQKAYPHLGAVKREFLVWAISRFKIAKVEELAANHLTPFLFQKAIRALAA